MQKKLLIYSIIGFFFTAVLGTLAHFAYDFSGQNPVLAFFVPINESTWEHMKLIFFPGLIFILCGYPFFDEEYPSFLNSFLLALVTGTMSVPVTFYTYTGILGRNYSFLDIGTFFFAVFLVFCLGYQMVIQNSHLLSKGYTYLIVIVLTLCFIAFTRNPPRIPLFIPPVTAGAPFGQIPG